LSSPNVALSGKTLVIGENSGLFFEEEMFKGTLLLIVTG
jgi:hypothetical protein